jgi:type II secretory pathway pseudopilin PulG
MLNTRKQLGFTLLEVLASFIILSLIFTVFFKFFSQAMLFQSKNEEDFVGINMAREILSEIENAPELFTSTQSYPPFNDNIQNILNVNIDGAFREPEYKNYKLQLNVTIDNRYSVLRKIHIIILNVETNQMITETYGYVKGP